MIQLLRSYAVLSDIHIGPIYDKAKRIISNLSKLFGDFTGETPLKHVDALFIAGDLFDDTLEFNSASLQEFIPFWANLLSFCRRHKIILRVMEGTPRHDRKQGKSIRTMVSLNIDNENLDMRYISTPEIEFIEKLGMSVLYVPDEVGTAVEVEQIVDGLFREKDLSQVDIGIMHGMFKHQLGTIPMSNKVHDAEYYLRRIRHYCSIGHIHTFSAFDRIIAQGSTDRLAHNEEEAKGYTIFREIAPNQWTYEFIENKTAMTYKSLYITKEDLNSALKKANFICSGLNVGDNFRIVAPKGHDILQAMGTLKERWPGINFTTKPVGKKDEVQQTEQHAADDFTPIILSEHTIVQAIFEEATLCNTLSPEESSLLFRDLERINESIRT